MRRRCLRVGKESDRSSVQGEIDNSDFCTYKAAGAHRTGRFFMYVIFVSASGTDPASSGCKCMISQEKQGMKHSRMGRTRWRISARTGLAAAALFVAACADNNGSPISPGGAQ